MSTLSTTAVTLLDHVKRMDPDGSIAAIAEVLNQTNAILNDIPFVESNLPTGHQVTMRTGLPTPAWRLFNQGVQPTKSLTAQVTEGIGMLEDWGEIDKDVAELNGNTSEFRLSEARPHLEGMNQELSQTIFYGNSATAPEEFTGLSIRYSSLSATNGQNVISGGGSGGDNMSVWLIGWGNESLFGTFPKGTKAGLFHEDLGLETVNNAGGTTGALMRAYRDHWQWKFGLVVKDWRYAVRICNIDKSNLVSKTSAADVIELMIRAIHHIPSLAMCKPVFYMNRTIMQMLDIQRRDDIISGAGLTWDTVDGMIQTKFRQIPIRICDQLLASETAVS